MTPTTPPPAAAPQCLQRSGLPSLAYHASAGRGASAVWLCGFRSDMGGTKAQYLADALPGAGHGFVRFDYRGCGRSQGDFEAATIGAWLQDALDVIDHVTTGPLILVGSSMGGWIALLAALARPERVRGLALIAPAPDFTERLLRPNLPPEAHAALAEHGVWLRPSAYGDGPYPITQTLLDEARAHLLLDAPIPLDIPVRILHGQQDGDVPFALSLELAERLTSADVDITLIKAGDHRLSTPADLARLEAMVVSMLAELTPPP